MHWHQWKAGTSRHVPYTSATTRLDVPERDVTTQSTPMSVVDMHMNKIASSSNVSNQRVNTKRPHGGKFARTSDRTATIRNYYNTSDWLTLTLERYQTAELCRSPPTQPELVSRFGVSIAIQSRFGVSIAIQSRFGVSIVVQSRFGVSIAIQSRFGATNSRDLEAMLYSRDLECHAIQSRF
ncbi:hypothetical protein J6590_043047 [Homalodisca vitripennis]|nr:hypothetical protein J6590_043047 [Homalodisca vitripennis]